MLFVMVSRGHGKGAAGPPERYALGRLILLIAVRQRSSAGKAATRGCRSLGFGRPAPLATRSRTFPHARRTSSRAMAGSANVLFFQEPRRRSGDRGSGRRVSPADRQGRGRHGIDPNILEGSFREKRRPPDVIAGTDPADASGLTQILAQTGQSLLGMHINLARSRSSPPDRPHTPLAAANVAVRLERKRAPDRRPLRSPPGPGRRCAPAARRAALRPRRPRVVSYHMGIGNLQQVLDITTAVTPCPTRSSTSTPHRTTTPPHTT